MRTYFSTHGLKLVPGIAAELGLDVTVGAWIDKDEDRNEREIASALHPLPRMQLRQVPGRSAVGTVCQSNFECALICGACSG